MPDAKLQSYLHFHLIVFIWGFTAVLGALISIEAVPLVWYRMGLASIFILIYIRYKKLGLSVSPKTLIRFAVAGVVIALHWLTFFGAIKISNVSVTLAMMSTGALFTAFLEPIFYKRKLIWYELLFGGIVVATLYVIFEVTPEYRDGILMALASAFLSAVFTLINGKLVHTHRPAVISYYELLIGTLFITAYLSIASLTDYAVSEADQHFFEASFFTLKASDWVYLGILASICTAYAFIASVKVMRHLSPYTIMLTINLEPVYGILLAFIFLGDKERMNPIFYYGAVVILAVVIANGILKNRRKYRSKREA